MIRDFWVKNYLSIRDKQELSFVAKGPSSELVTEVADGVFLYKLGILYGSNASGKSNMLIAMNEVFRLLVMPKSDATVEIGGCIPFVLTKDVNPKITDGLDLDKVMKVYIHCSGTYTYQGDEILLSRDIRLMRRMLRDARERDFSYKQTLDMWQEVCKGEDENILPYLDEADEYINTFHSFEALLYKTILTKDLDVNEYTKELFSKLTYVGRLKPNLVPKDSVVREFIGGYNSDD